MKEIIEERIKAEEKRREKCKTIQDKAKDAIELYLQEEVD
jgi:hypothetical protein